MPGVINKDWEVNVAGAARVLGECSRKQGHRENRGPDKGLGRSWMDFEDDRGFWAKECYYLSEILAGI